MLGHDLAEPGGQCLVRLHPGLHLLGGEDGAAVGERRDVAGGLHHSVPPGQHLQPVLLHQHLPKHTQLGSDGGDKGLAIYKVKFIYPCGTLWPSYILMPLLLPGVFLHLFLVEAPAFLLACRTATSCAVTAPPRRPPGPSLDTRPANTDMAAGSVMKSKHK